VSFDSTTADPHDFASVERLIEFNLILQQLDNPGMVVS